MIMIEAYFNLSSHNFSVHDLANYQNQLECVVVPEPNLTTGNKIYLIIRRYLCITDKTISEQVVLDI